MHILGRTPITLAVASVLFLIASSTTADTIQPSETETVPVTDQSVAAPGEDAKVSAPSANQPEANQQQLLEQLRDAAYRPFRSLLVEREMPLVGIRWGADVQADIPLNGEPEGAAPDLREAKLVFYRSFGAKWSAKLEANYNSLGKFEVGDTYAVYTGWKSAGAKFGIFKPPYSLNYQTGRTKLTFMERALPVAALSERRSTGGGIVKRTPKAIMEAGVFLYSPDQDGQQEKGQAVIARYVHAPLDPDEGLGLGVLGGRGIWAGVSVSYRANATGPNTQFRSVPEVSVGDDYFVDTGPISNAQSILRVGLEANTVQGSFSWQAEVLTAQVRRDGEPSVFFYGGYVFASWFLTGESRNYNSALGDWSYIVPNRPVRHGGWGAWEVALRASTVDLNDKDIIGGRERNITFGLNWYLNERLRVEANLIKVLDVKRPGSQFDGQDPFIAALRLQWYLP
jgi:phosphate-selective porin OprO/OprP